MTLTIKNNKGEFTVSPEDFAEKYRLALLRLPERFMSERNAANQKLNLLDFLQSYSGDK